MTQATQAPITIDDINVGDFVQTTRDWHAVMYKYGNDLVVSATGLGKRGCYPIALSEITAVEKTTPVLFELLQRTGDLVLESEGRTFVLKAPEVYIGPALFEMVKGTDEVRRLVHLDNVAFLYQLGGAKVLGYISGETRSELLAEAIKVRDSDAPQCSWEGTVDTLATLLERSASTHDLDYESLWFPAKGPKLVDA